MVVSILVAENAEGLVYVNMEGVRLRARTVSRLGVESEIIHHLYIILVKI